MPPKWSSVLVRDLLAGEDVWGLPPCRVCTVPDREVTGRIDSRKWLQLSCQALSSLGVVVYTVVGDLCLFLSRVSSRQDLACPCPLLGLSGTHLIPCRDQAEPCA